MGSSCTYRVEKQNTNSCQLYFHLLSLVSQCIPFLGLCELFLLYNNLSFFPFFRLRFGSRGGCAACGGTPTVHLLTFSANAVLTYALASRLYRCYEDYFEQYHRMLYFIQLTPWSTMKHTYRKIIAGEAAVFQKHEHYGLLPTFDLDCIANIVAWNKLRIFLQTYEQRSSRRLQVSVVYLLSAWVATCIYQGVKAWVRRGDEVVDIETIFVFSSTSMLAVGLSAIIFTGKSINDITQIGFSHVLRVKQAELLEKSTHYLVEHDFFNGSFAHDGSHGAATSRKKCLLHEHHYGDLGGLQLQSIQGLDRLKVSQLRERCRLTGVCDEDIRKAVDDTRSPKTALIELLERRQAVVKMEQEGRRPELGLRPQAGCEQRCP